MKTVYVADLVPGDMVTGQTFVITELKAATDKNGNPYYDLVLGDKTGQIRSKIWSDALANQVDKQALKAGKVVAIDAKVDEYKGTPQLSILVLRGVDEAQLDEFLESSEFDADEMWVELQNAVSAISNKSLQQLLTTILQDKEIATRYKYWPAAATIHHDFRSGLLQHVLEMLAIAQSMQKYYPEVDFGIVTAGIVLHDIGKLYELDGSGIVATYTTTGSLLGHITIGVELLAKFATADFPQDLLVHLKHIILSHHGALEYGSPVLPATREAVIVSHIDDLSSKARTVDKAIRHESTDDLGFTAHNRWMGTKLWSGSAGE